MCFTGAGRCPRRSGLMLEHIPRWLGTAMRGMRAGADKLAIVQLTNGIEVGTIDLMSPAFANEGRLPPRFTADGAGLSPPLVWGTLPPKTAAIALIVEDADAPTPTPLVHAIVWDLPPDEHRSEEHTSELQSLMRISYAVFC